MENIKSLNNLFLEGKTAVYLSYISNEVMIDSVAFTKAKRALD